MKKTDEDRASQYFSKANGEAAAIETSQLKAEIEKRSMEPVFPLEAFHPSAKDFMIKQHIHLDIPRSYVGTTMLGAYSTAIGNGYRASSGGSQTVPLSLWLCLVGISSSGKTLAIGQNFNPLQEIQSLFDQEWEKVKGLSALEQLGHRMKTVLFRDVLVATLARTVMPENPKGTTKMADELLEFINGLNQHSNKEGIDEQFWVSGWDGTDYSGIRANRVKFTIPKLFANVVGGIQPSVLWKLFQKDRATTGFIFRMLFALAEIRIAEPDSSFRMPEELTEIHNRCIKRLYHELPVSNAYEEPKMLVLDPEANQLRDAWRKKKIQSIKQLADPVEREVYAGILGKMYDYALRFCGLLCVADMSYNGMPFASRVTMDAQLMERALMLADYYYQSAWQAYSRSKNATVAPEQVLRFAAYLRAGLSNQRIGDLEYPGTKVADSRRRQAARELKKMIAIYPRVFGAIEKTGN